MTSLLLSVAIPVYNGSATIEETIESVASQIVGGRVEIVVSDNASTDTTLDIISKLKKKYPFIRSFKNTTNLGYDKNVNLAVERSLGKFVWLLGDDDLLDVGAINKVVDVVSQEPDLGALFVNYSLCDRGTGKIVKERFLPITEDVFCETGSDFLKAATIYPNFVSSIVVSRNEWMESNPLKYEGTFWIQYGTLLTVVLKSKSLCIAQPFVINKARMSDEPNMANNGGIALPILLNLLDIIYSFSDKQFSASSKKEAFIEVKKLLPRKIMSAKRNGLKVNIELVKRLTSRFKWGGSYWVLYLPILLLPRNFHYYAWRIYRHKLINPIFSILR